jgi:hypothetical protein
MFSTKSAIALLVAGAATVLAPSATAFAAPAPAAHGTCRISVLPDLPGIDSSRVSAGDPTGRYLIGDAYPTDAPQVSVLWTAGKPRQIKTPGVQGRLIDVNSSGTMIGAYIDADGHQHAFVSNGRRVTDLPPSAPGASTWPIAINTRGDVLGGNIEPSGQAVYVVWPAGRPSEMRRLTIPDGAMVPSISDIDDDGTVVGTLSFPDRVAAYVWPAHGQPYALPYPAGVTGANATVIRHGWIGGYRYLAGALPVRWSPHNHRAEVINAGEHVATAINSSGTMAAESVVVHRDGRVVTLPDVPGGVSPTAYTIADNGTLAGAALGTGNSRAVVWHGC